jgi:hypothetical protein
VRASRPLPAPPASGPPDITIQEHATRCPSPFPSSARGYSYGRLATGEVHVSWSDLFDFVVSADGSRIDVYAEPANGVEPVYTYLISQVISVALLEQKVESLHASAVAIGGKAIALIGESGFGKSTLTAALVQAGAELVTDDLLVLREHADGYLAAPGAFRIKLEPATAVQLGIEWSGVPMADGSGKLVYFLDPAECCSSDIPLERILFIQPHASRASLEPVALADATRELLAATFNPLHTEASRLQRLLRNAELLARGSRTERLYVPRDLPNIDAVVNLIA